MVTWSGCSGQIVQTFQWMGGGGGGGGGGIEAQLKFTSGDEMRCSNFKTGN